MVVGDSNQTLVSSTTRSICFPSNVDDLVIINQDDVLHAQSQLSTSQHAADTISIVVTSSSGGNANLDDALPVQSQLSDSQQADDASWSSSTGTHSDFQSDQPKPHKPALSATAAPYVPVPGQDLSAMDVFSDYSEVERVVLGGLGTACQASDAWNISSQRTTDSLSEQSGDLISEQSPLPFSSGEIPASFRAPAKPILKTTNLKEFKIKLNNLTFTDMDIVSPHDKYFDLTEEW